MRLPITVVTIALAASLLPGQDKPGADKPNQSPEIKTDGFEATIIPVKTLTGDSFNRLARLLGVFNNARFTSDEKLRTIIVYAPKDVVAQMRRVIEELDRPGSQAAIGRNIDMTMTFLRCSPKVSSSPSTLPGDLEGVARQLRAATQYKDIQFMDAIPLRLQEGKMTQESFSAPGNTPGASPSLGQIRIQPEAVSTRDSGRYVRFEQINISWRVSYPTGTFFPDPAKPVPTTQYNFMDLNISTAGDFMEGQKTVIGKLSGPNDDSAIFVVISLKVLD